MVQFGYPKYRFYFKLDTTLNNIWEKVKREYKMYAVRRSKSNQIYFLQKSNKSFVKVRMPSTPKTIHLPGENMIQMN